MTTDNQDEEYAAIHVAMGAVSAVCDYARTDDGRGFNAIDAWLGHSLAEMPAAAWTSDAALAAWDMLRKYRGQLAAAGIDYDQLPRPDGADELEAERSEEARQRARDRARQWRDQQYRKSRSYVRCDGDGEDVVLSFAYDPDLVAACRKIEGRVYDGTTKTNRYPFSSLPDVIKFADDHDIDVTPDVRALAAIAADRAADLAAELAARPEIRFEVSRHDQLVGVDGEPVHETIAIDAPYDPALTAALKELNGGSSTWDSADGLHRVPLRCVSRLPEIAGQFSLRISDEARAHIAAVTEAQAGTRAAADAFEADPVPVPGLASGLALKPQQYPVVRFALEHRRVLIGDDMGWGKTLSSLAAAAADDAYPAVVVCRPSLTLNWSSEIRRFFPGLAVYEASGTAPQPVPPGTDVVIIGSAALAAKPRKTSTGKKEFGWVTELAKIGPKALIVDEGQDTKERSANRSQACEQLAADVIARNGLVLDLTGTAILNRPRELCQQLAMLGRIWEFGGEKKFLWRYCLSETNGYGASYNGACNLIELHDRLRAWGIMIRRSDDAALGLPPCREHVLVIPQADLDPGVMKRYREAETDLLDFLARQARETAERLGKDPDSAAVEATMRAASAEHLVAINALRQLAGQAKRGYVTRWIRARVDTGEKVMVAAHHRPEVDAYAAAFGDLKLQGGQSVAEKEKAKAAFQRKPAADAPVISVAIGAGGVGHTLTAARIGIQAEQAWTPGETQQMKKRLHRIGQDRPVDYYITVAEGTIDEQLWSVVTSKQATLDAVLDGRSDSAAAADETSVAAELTWRLTRQGLGNPVPASTIPDDAADDDDVAGQASLPELPEEQAGHEMAAASDPVQDGDALRPGPGRSQEDDTHAKASEPASQDDGQPDDGQPGAFNAFPGGGNRGPSRGGFHPSWPATAEEARMADALSRGERVPGGPGACVCGHLTLWHGEHGRYDKRPCRQCDCQAFRIPDEHDLEPLTPEALRHWEAGNVSTSRLAEAHQLAVDDPARWELIEALLNAPVRGWLPIPRHGHLLSVQWDATRGAPPLVPDQSVKVTLILPDYRFVLGVRTTSGGQFQYRDVSDGEALAALLVPEGALPDGPEALREPASVPGTEPGLVRETGVCAVCHTTMTIIQPGQTAHPLCDDEDDEPTAITAVTGQPAPQEEEQTAGNAGDLPPAKDGTAAGRDSGANAAQVREEDEEDDAQARTDARISPERLREFGHRYLDEGLLPVPAWGARLNGECCCPRGAGCPRPGKHPRSVRTGPNPGEFSWKPLACQTHEEVEKRFADDSEYAAGNLMVAIPEGVMAIDRDDDDGGRAAVAALAGELGTLPPTLSHRTPHGEHLIYRTPEGWKGRAWVGKAPGNPVPPGIDLRMPGQILMAAPSIVPGQDGPATYGPVNAEHIAPLPTEYVTAWTPPQPQPREPASSVPVPVPDTSAGRAAKYVSDAMVRIADDLASREPGGRNPAAYAAGLKAGSLLGAARRTPGAEHAAWSDQQAEQALLEACRLNGYTDKDGEAEALRAIRSGLKNGLRAPRALPDFTTHRTPPVTAPRPRPAARPSEQQTVSPARERSAAAASHPAGRWQDLVTDDIRHAVEAADTAAGARRRAAIAAHQEAIEQHDRAPSAETAAEVRRTAAEADAAHQAYTQDGRHIVGRHDAAMLRWAAATTAQHEQAATEPGKQSPGTIRSRADTAAEAAIQAYRAGELDEARRMTEEAAASDPSRDRVWQQYRDQIDARQAVLASRQAYRDAGGDWQHAEQLLGQTRQINPRIRGRAIWNQDLPSPSAPLVRHPAPRTAEGNPRPKGRRNQAPQRQRETDRGGSRIVQRDSGDDTHQAERAPSGQAPAADAAKQQPDGDAEKADVGPDHAAGIDPDRWPAPNPRTAPRDVSPDPNAPHGAQQPESLPAEAEPVSSTGRVPEVDVSGWPARNPHARPESPSPAEEPENRQVPQPNRSTGPESSHRSEFWPHGADWRDPFCSAEREYWQPPVITPYDFGVPGTPQTATPGEEIEPDQ